MGGQYNGPINIHSVDTHGRIRNLPMIKDPSSRVSNDFVENRISPNNLRLRPRTSTSFAVL